MYVKGCCVKIMGRWEVCEWMVIEVDGMVCEGEGWSVKVNGCCGKMMSSSVCKVSY